MALLIVEQPGKRRAGVIRGRVLIGRRPESQLWVQHDAVSRVHAWIGADEMGEHFIADAGSRTGTFVNDERIAGRRSLQLGDRIRVGPVSLRLTDGQAVPTELESIDLAARPHPVPSPKAGIWFDCACGAPVWVPWTYAGRVGECRLCSAPLAVPRPPGSEAAATPPSARPTQQSEAVARPTCGVCHGQVQPLEESTRCPSCGTDFHAECWAENGGCSVYGCGQVSMAVAEEPLEATPAEEPGAMAAAAAVEGETPAVAPAPVPWAYVLLAANVLGVVAGALTFGGPALLAAVAAVSYLLRSKPKQHRAIANLAAALGAFGTVAGIALSYYWWLGGRR